MKRPFDPRAKHILPTVPPGMIPAEQWEWMKRNAHRVRRLVCLDGVPKLPILIALVVLLAASVSYAGVGKRLPDGPQVSVGDVCPQKGPASVNGAVSPKRFPAEPQVSVGDYCRLLLVRFWR